jgi:uncharacterized damage-inducible protein DinB
MNLDDIRHLIGYNEWANARLFDIAASLSEEQLSREAASSFSSVIETLAHIAVAEWLWLERWKGISPAAVPAWTERPQLAEVRKELRSVERDRAAFVAALDDETLQRRLPYRRINGEEGEGRLADLIAHVVNHSTYHRGQVVTLVRQAGGTPVTTDLLFYDSSR